MHLNSVSSTNFNGILCVSGVRTTPKNLIGNYMENVLINTSEIKGISGLNINPEYAIEGLGIRFLDSNSLKIFTDSIKKKINNTAYIDLVNNDRFQLKVPVKVLEDLYAKAKQSDETFFLK